MDDRSDERARVAYHEAGHAVVLFALARGFDRASIVPDDDLGALGLVTLRVTRLVRELDHRQPDTLKEQQALRDGVVAALAGAEAEARFSDRPVRDVATQSGYDDFYLAELLAEALEASPKVRSALFEYLSARAADLLDIHWYLVKALASELLSRETLSGPAVHRLLQRTIREQPEAADFGVDDVQTGPGWRDLADLVGRAQRGWG